jgi:SiaC family regulatory phosphoprotein
MKSFIHKATDVTPEIILSPEENKFIISGKSAPEDVRGLYYPVLEWMEEFVAGIRRSSPYSDRNHLRFKLDLEYFNSSSAKFLFDIFTQLRDLNSEGVPVDIEWYYDEEDTDLREAGEDLSLLCELPFKYFPKNRDSQ